MTAPLTRRSLDPSRPIGLTRLELEIARLTVEGFISEEMARAGNTNCGWPLSLRDAAKATGYRIKRAMTYLDLLPEFQAERARLLKGRRQSEEAGNLATAVMIRDDPGDGKAADRTVQLKAIGVIEGNDKAPGVVVNVQQNSVAAISPGYVIKIPVRQPPAIEHEP